MDIDKLLLHNEIDALPLGPTSYYYEKLVPKDLAGNLEFRRTCLELGYQDRQFARDLWIMCSRDILFYINTFVWTLSPKDEADQPIIPFITYGYQDDGLKVLEECIGKEDLVIPKTRDMGATWMCLLAMKHRWNFRPTPQLFLLASEKEPLVDGKSQRTLFKKLDFIHKYEPDWLKPQSVRTYMHFGNADTGSSFDGEATVAELGTGDRRTAILLDEYSKMKDADQIDTATRDVSNCRIFLSTPLGRYGKGAAFYAKAKNRYIRQMFLHWTVHPLKSQGLYKNINGKKKKLPAGYDWRKDYDFEQLCFLNKDERPRSDWYELQCRRANYNDKQISQELDIDFLGSSERLCDPQVIDRARKEDARPPVAVGRLGVDEDDFEAKWKPDPNGIFKLWLPFDQVEPPPGKYVIGADISGGTAGRYTSNSALVIINAHTKEQVGLWASNDLPPIPFAKFTAGVGRWFHDAYIVPEVNGPGGTQFIKTLVECNYPNIYRQDKELIGHDDKHSKLGYHNRDGGISILRKLENAISEKQVKIRDAAILDQMLQYEWVTGAKIEHAGSRVSESQADKGKGHGDEAVAAGCAWLGVTDALSPLGTGGPDGNDEPPVPDYPCVAQRMAERDKQLAAQSADEW